MKTNSYKLKITAGILILLFACNTLMSQVKDSCEFFLWKTEINKSTFYLSGSVHVGKKEYFPLHSKYLECFNKSNKVIMEVAEDFETIETRMLEYIQKDKLAEDKYFRNNLDSVSIRKIIGILGEETFHEFDIYNSWILVLQLSVNKMKLFDYEPVLAVDKYIRELADKYNK